jgi:hypothetical protein
MVLASLAVSVGAQTLTPAQVREQTSAAWRASDIPHGDLDFSSVNPHGDIHPAQSASSDTPRTREHVKAELRQAVAEGQLQFGEIGHSRDEIEAARHPHPDLPPVLTREQVRAELAKAIRYGEVQFGETGRTLAEVYPQRYAAVRARDGLATVAGN